MALFTCERNDRTSNLQQYLLLAVLSEWRKTCDELTLQIAAAEHVQVPVVGDAICAAATLLASEQMDESGIAMSGPVTLWC